jgi:hypothetical protein
MKRLAILLALLVAASALAGQAKDEKDFRMSIEDPDNLLMGKEGLIGKEFLGTDFKMMIVRPGPGIDYKMIIVRPDPKTRFTMMVVDPTTRRQITLPRDVEDKLRSILESHRRK